MLDSRTLVATFPNLGPARVDLSFASVRLDHPDLYALDLLVREHIGGPFEDRPEGSKADDGRRRHRRWCIGRFRPSRRLDKQRPLLMDAIAPRVEEEAASKRTA